MSGDGTGLTSRYLFDHVLGQEATQEDVFKRTAMPLLEGILTGYNATIFAYGVSDSHEEQTDASGGTPRKAS